MNGHWVLEQSAPGAGIVCRGLEAAVMPVVQGRAGLYGRNKPCAWGKESQSKFAWGARGRETRMGNWLKHQR